MLLHSGELAALYKIERAVVICAVIFLITSLLYFRH
jgi:hypothetical protein